MPDRSRALCDLLMQVLGGCCRQVRSLILPQREPQLWPNLERDERYAT